MSYNEQYKAQNSPKSKPSSETQSETKTDKEEAIVKSPWVSKKVRQAEKE